MQDVEEIKKREEAATRKNAGGKGPYKDADAAQMMEMVKKAGGLRKYSQNTAEQYS